MWNNFVVVTLPELVPNWFNTESTLKNTIRRYENKPYGVKKVQSGGNGRQLLVDFYTLPQVIQDGIGDIKKLNHVLDQFYKTDSAAVSFFTKYRFPDGTYLDVDYQERYITNASVLHAARALKLHREAERRGKGNSASAGIMQTVLDDVVSFQTILEKKHNVKHTLPPGLKQWKKVFEEFNTGNYAALISNKHKNMNSVKVTDLTLELLKNLFAGQPHKPTATEIHAQYDAFLTGYLEVINNKTGEIYHAKDFKKLSANTVTSYMAQWANKIGTHAKRSGDRQKFMQAFKPYHSLDKPKYAGSIISIDDRNPPFKMEDGNRVWFYNGIDLGSEAFTCWVHGKSKDGIILEFYRQMVRNYAAWGVNIPAELEAEMSLNSAYVNTFLKEGAMFQYVRIEANNARGKRIEAYFKPLRYGLEKKREGWLARPFALSEANQAGANDVPVLRYEKIVYNALEDIETWNNMPHSVHKHLSRWEVFMTMQNPNVQPTNYEAILRHVGERTKTSCNVGIIHLNNAEFLLGDDSKIATGNKLIGLMKQVEGRDIDVYWLDDNEGRVLKAHIYIGTQLICEAIAKPRYQKARIEQTDQDILNRQLMSSYVATIEAYGRRQKQSLDSITIIDNTPKPKKAFIMPGLRQPVYNTAPLDNTPADDDDDMITTGTYSGYKPLKDRF